MEVIGYNGLGDPIFMTEAAPDGKALVRLWGRDRFMVRMTMAFEQEVLDMKANEAVAVVCRRSLPFRSRLEVYASSRAWFIWQTEVPAEEGERADTSEGADAVPAVPAEQD